MLNELLCPGKHGPLPKRLRVINLLLAREHWAFTMAVDHPADVLLVNFDKVFGVGRSVLPRIGNFLTGQGGFSRLEFHGPFPIFSRPQVASLKIRCFDRLFFDSRERHFSDMKL